MPFGLCNAPATYQRLMNVAMAGLDPMICLVYLNDIYRSLPEPVGPFGPAATLVRSLVSDRPQAES